MHIFLSLLPVSFFLTALYFSVSGEKVDKKYKEKSRWFFSREYWDAGGTKINFY